MKNFSALFLLLCCVLNIHAETSGQLNDNISWTLSDDGTLTISGTGDMPNYFNVTDSPFYNNSNIKEIIINSGVTSIGAYAFQDCSGLTSVTIPNSVTSIVYAAFYNCSGLTSVTIPNSVTHIGGYAFYGCSGLTSIIVEEGNSKYDSRDNCNAIIETLSNILLFGCQNTIIPNSVTSIGNIAFYGCSSLTSVTIPNSVTSIGSEAFAYCSGLTSVTIPNSVTSIGSYAYYGCSGLTSVTIPNSVTSISDSAFEGCSGLTSITIPNSVTSIGFAAFSDCSSLTSVTIPNSVTSIGSEAFAYCSGLTSVDIPNSVTSIGSSAFFGCSGLTSVTIPNSVMSIGIGAFYGCSGLTSIIVEESNSKYDSRDNCNAIIETSSNILLFGCQNTIIPNSVKSIDGQAFAYCRGLTSITIPNSVTSIGIGAFYGCSGLTSVTIPNSVTSIGGWAFRDCSGLTSVDIPNSVTSIGSEAFYGCSSLSDVTNFATTPQDIGEYTFSTYGTLHVLPGCGAAYGAADYWKNFTILEDAGIVSITDGEEIEYVQDYECTEIHYTRNFLNTNWQSLYVPFALPYDTWSADFDIARINDVHQYDTDDDGEIDDTELEVIKLRKGSTKPNTPYLIRAKQSGTQTITLSDATLYKTEEISYDVTSWNTRFTFTGTYHTISGSVMLDEGYYAFGGGSMHQVADASNSLKPMRWYLDVTDRDGEKTTPNNARQIRIHCLDETTGISVTSPDTTTTNGEMYNLSGQKINTTTIKSGIYIKNGKKIMVR